VLINNAGGERVGRSQVTSKDDLPPIKPKLGTTSQHRIRPIHTAVCVAHKMHSDASLVADSISYIIQDSICFLCICSKSYPRKLAFTYLSDLATEFTTTYPATQYHSPTLRPYAFVEFDTFIQRTKKTYQDSRASANLDKLNDELKDVTKVMTKNIEDLLYRGDSLERMGEMSGRLREDSKKYRKAAVRINWELLLKQVILSPPRSFIVPRLLMPK
jgi:Regulated-SNARE-like domain/Synaptobrevin